MTFYGLLLGFVLGVAVSSVVLWVLVASVWRK